MDLPTHYRYQRRTSGTDRGRLGTVAGVQLSQPEGGPPPVWAVALPVWGP